MDVNAEKLNETIANSYDESSNLLEELFGNHMHHGFYDSSDSNSDFQSAQIRMIEAALRFASISEDPLKAPKSIVDIGCGLGGSSLYLAKKFDTQCKGITLGYEEVQRARAIATAQGLDCKVSFEVADAMNQPFPDGQFDLVWCIECAEHMPDKAKFVHELARVAAPGATIIIVTWCHRDLSPFEQSLHPDEEKFLKKMYDASHSPKWCSTNDYVDILKSINFQDIRSADWSRFVAPSWPAMTRLILSWKGITSIMRRGWKSMEGVMGMRLLAEGHKKGILKYSIITCRKPQ